jgi:TetR/AcrR family transcriptional regulator
MKHIEHSPTTSSVILDAAERHFAEFGYQRVSMEEIAAAAGLAKPSLYYYFDTKDELFRAVVDRKFNLFAARVADLLKTRHSARQKLRQYVRDRYLLTHGLWNINFSDFKSDVRNRPIVKEMFRRYSAEELKWLTSVFAEGKKSGEFVLAAPGRVALTFLHIMQGLRQRFMRAAEPETSPKDHSGELLGELLFAADLILDGLQPRKAGRSGVTPRKQSRVHSEKHAL